MVKIAKKARVYDGTAWQELASAQTDLTAYSTTAQTTAGFRNAIINGGMDVWQRGTSSLAIGNASVAASTTVDRWASYRPANPTAVTVSRISGSEVPGAPYASRIQRTSSNTTVDKVTFGQTIEIANASKFAGKNITLSFYARAGANFSPTSSLITNIMKTGTGTTDLNGIYNSYTGEVSSPSNNTLTTSFQRFTRTISLASNVTQIAIAFEFTPTGTAGANDYLDITGVQLEEGSVATPFEQRPIGTELALCQRYYIRMSGQAYTAFGSGVSVSTTKSGIYVSYPAMMRAIPTSVGFSNLIITDRASYDLTVSSFDSDNRPGLNSAYLAVIHSSSATALRPALLTNVNGTVGFLDFSAEL